MLRHVELFTLCEEKQKVWRHLHNSFLELLAAQILINVLSRNTEKPVKVPASTPPAYILCSYSNPSHKMPTFYFKYHCKTERILYYSIIITASCSNAIFDWRFFIKFISVGLHWLECGYLILEPPHRSGSRSGSRCGSRSRGVKSLENISLKSPKSGWICIFCKKLNFVSNICKFSDFESILWSYSSQLN